MFLSCNRVFVILLIEYLLILCDDGFLTLGTRGYKTVAANNILGFQNISGPFLQIEKPPITRLIITEPHLTYSLPCTSLIDEEYHHRTIFFHTWYRNDHEIKSKHGQRRDDFDVLKNGSLRLPRTEKASGVYRCKVYANTTGVLSESITVEFPVLKRIQLHTGGSNVTGFIGLPLTFDCPILSVPEANVTWSYGNVSLSKIFKENRYLILANGSLVIRQLALKDGGKYKCIAQNNFAIKPHRQFVWSLTVVPRPLDTGQSYAQLIPPLQNETLYIPAGNNFKLSCHALTDLVPIEWWYQHSMKSDVIPTKLSNHSNEYNIPIAQTDLHEGYYTCSTPKENQTFHVIVTVPPTIIEPLTSFELGISASKSFNCKTAGNPKPTIFWYHNGALLNSSYTRYINGNELHFHSFDPDEDGIYQCFARNIAGEASSAFELRLKNKSEAKWKNPLRNIRCYAHSFNTINITFDSKSYASLFVVHIVESNPHRWISPFAPMTLNHSSYVIISSHLPVYRPFKLITRALNPTSEIRFDDKPPMQVIRSSLRSPPVTCCTQGLLLHLVHLGNDTFVTWSQTELDMKKYFILQFSINFTYPHPQQLLLGTLRGTSQHVELTPDDVEKKLTNIEILNRTATRDVLNRVEGKYIDNEAEADHLESEEDIFNLVVPANITGILLQNFTRIKLRVLIITAENENLAQDFRYVQWKIIQNDSVEQMNAPFHLTTVESRMVVFHFPDSFNESCVHVCHYLIKFPLIHKEEPKCEKRILDDAKLELRGLKPTARYHLKFFSCKTQLFYGQLDVQTLPDPPGTISNQRIIRQQGLKLIWEPPLQPNGRVHHYNIRWTLGNMTHEANVLECAVCFYKFPNISEAAKINVTVRVVGETGVGAPILIDLRDVDHQTLEIERTSTSFEVYRGIAIGSFLSVLCILAFGLFLIMQRRRYKARQPPPVQFTTPSDINFGNIGNLTNPGIPGDSAGALSGSTLQQECLEMQTLIPKTGRQLDFCAKRSSEYQTTPVPNSNGRIPRNMEQKSGELDQSSYLEQPFDGNTEHNLSQMPLCSSTPERKGCKESILPIDAKPFYIPFKHSPPNVIVAPQSRQSSLTSYQSSAVDGGNIVIPPNSLPLVTTLPYGNGSSTAGRRSGSLSSCSGSSSSSKKQFHTNFPKHSNSNDGICLLAEEESAAMLTPTTEREMVAAGALTNGFKTVATIATTTADQSESITTGTASTTCPSATTPTNNASTTTTSQTNLNNNFKLRNSANEAKNSNLSKRLLPSSTHSPSNQPNKVPAVKANTTAAPKLHWVTTNTNTLPPILTGNNLHRRPNVDPNG